MKCPVCKDQDLVMSERQNIEVDYCPNCRGIWLDRGELDKIIERAAPELSQTTQAPPPPRAPSPRPDDSHHGYRYDPHYDKHHGGRSKYHKKKKHWLLELLD